MSTDRRRLANNAQTKPLTPRLAATASTPSRSSPTPKLAGYATSSASTSAVSAPASRRPLSTNTSELNIGTRLTETESAATKDVTSHITPRSSARKSRTDSAQSTPTRPADDTPTQRRPVSFVSPANVGKSRVPLADDKTDGDVNRFSSPASFATRVQQGQGYPLSPLVTATATGDDDVPAPEEKDSYFFHANDVQREQKAARPLLHKPGVSFMYANGEEERPPDSAPPPAAPALARPASFARSESAPAPDSQQPSASALFNLASRPTISPPPPTTNGGLRAPSPPRPGFHLSYRKGASQIIRPSPLSPSAQITTEHKRRQSSLDGIDEERRRSRNLSVSSGDSNLANKQENGLSLLHTFTVPSQFTSPAISPTSHPQETERSNGLRLIDGSLGSDRLQSPTEGLDSGESNQNLNEAANGARRERKILDLQISNSSLLAINKSLEKEVRKQKTELRRFKRMSRIATRESLLSQASEVSDAQLTTISEADGGVDDLDSAEEDDELEADDDDDDESDSSEFEDDPTSPGAISQRDARHRKGDQRRLVADLVKHKELLADSQRMNQSILKCLSVTELLIKDGNRALEYQVPLEEVRLGGRVLSPEEQEDAAADTSYFDELPAGLGDTDALPPPGTADALAHRRREDMVREVLDSADALAPPSPPTPAAPLPAAAP